MSDVYTRKKFTTFNNDIADKYGVQEAIFICNLHFWYETNTKSGTNFMQNKYWSYMPIKKLMQLFSYWSRQNLRTIIKSCIKQDAILTSKNNDFSPEKVISYTLTDSCLEIFNKDKIKNNMDENINLVSSNQPLENYSLDLVGVNHTMVDSNHTMVNSNHTYTIYKDNKKDNKESVCVLSSNLVDNNARAEARVDGLSETQTPTHTQSYPLSFSSSQTPVLSSVQTQEHETAKQAHHATIYDDELPSHDLNEISSSRHVYDGFNGNLRETFGVSETSLVNGVVNADNSVAIYSQRSAVLSDASIQQQFSDKFSRYDLTIEKLFDVCSAYYKTKHREVTVELFRLWIQRENADMYIIDTEKQKTVEIEKKAVDEMQKSDMKIMQDHAWHIKNSYMPDTRTAAEVQRAIALIEQSKKDAEFEKANEIARIKAAQSNLDSTFQDFKPGDDLVDKDRKFTRSVYTGILKKLSIEIDEKQKAELFEKLNKQFL